MNISLQGYTALICGSTQGIGEAIAHEMAMQGAACILMARNEEKLKAIIQVLPNSHLHSYLVVDFSKLENIEVAVPKLLQKAPIHILVNNTGGPAPGLISEASTAQFADAFAQHVLANQLLAQALLPGMKEAGYGRIINITSTSIRIPIPNLGVSNTIRAAVASWAKTWSIEVGQFNITVNTIMPGFTKTARLDSLVNNMTAAQGISKDEMIEQLHADIPMRRFGEASEVANVAAFLASPAASYIHGTTIAVDGGRTGTI